MSAADATVVVSGSRRGEGPEQHHAERPASETDADDAAEETQPETVEAQGGDDTDSARAKSAMPIAAAVVAVAAAAAGATARAPSIRRRPPRSLSRRR